MTFNIFKKITLVFGLFVLPSCGQSKQKVDVRDLSSMRSDTSKSGLVNDPNCTKTECPSVKVALRDDQNRDISNRDKSNGAPLQGALGKEIYWKIKAVSSDAPAGRIRIALVESPLWMKSEPDADPGSLIVTGQPQAAIAIAKITILARDMNRCAIKNALKDCQNVSVSFRDFDETFTLEYSIK